MISAKVNDTQFFKDMQNIIAYSEGFIDGANRGKTKFLEGIGDTVIESLKQYIDSNARVDPKALQHVYEWYQSGSPSARLFDISYVVTNGGLSVNSTFKQSSSIKDGSKEPFYDKARIMEQGIPVTIKPKNSNVLVFDENGEKIFTKNPITVSDPGGIEAQGSYQQAFENFFKMYFSQIFLRTSGIMNYLEKPVLYKEKMSAGKRGGRSVGVSTGYKWMSQAGGVI